MTQVTLGIIYIHNDNFHGIRSVINRVATLPMDELPGASKISLWASETINVLVRSHK